MPARVTNPVTRKAAKPAAKRTPKGKTAKAAAPARKGRKVKVVNFRLDAPGYKTLECSTRTGVVLTLGKLVNRGIKRDQIQLQIRSPKSKKREIWYSAPLTVVEA